MVERRCRTALLAQTEGVAEPLPARNEVNPRTDMNLSLTDIRTDTTAPLFSLMPHTPVETSSSLPAVFITHPVLQAVLTATQEMVHRMGSVVGSGVQGAGCAPGERHVFVYNTENMLTGMYVYTGSTLTYEAHYGYDPLGRRIEKRETDHTGGKTNIEQYVYRDEDIVFRIIVDPNTGERAVNQVYTHGELAVDDPVAFPDCPNAVCSSGGWAFPGKDQVQSVESIFDMISLTNNSLMYSSFGMELKNRRFQNFQLYNYTSREYEKSYIIYFRKRYYIGILGVFLTSDLYYITPIYKYARQNLIMYLDPYGLYCTQWKPTKYRIIGPENKNPVPVRKGWKLFHSDAQNNKGSVGGKCICVWVFGVFYRPDIVWKRTCYKASFCSISNSWNEYKIAPAPWEEFILYKEKPCVTHTPFYISCYSMCKIAGNPNLNPGLCNSIHKII